MFRSRWLCFLGGMLLAAMLLGCRLRTGEISGKVTYQGKPLPSGRISLFCEGGEKPVLSQMVSDGAYAFSQVPIGKAQVTVITFQSRHDPIPGEPEVKSPPPPDIPAAPASGPYVPIPARYRMPDTSGLAVTIVGGKQTRDWELTP